MANYLNIFAGIIAFLGSTSLAYGLWTPVNDFISYLPTELYILCGVLWIALLFVCVVYFPFILIVSDDKG